MNDKNVVLGVLFAIVCFSVFSGLAGYFIGVGNDNGYIEKDYDFRYYSSDYHFFDDLNVSVRFYSNDKADDSLTFLFFEDGNYTLSIFYDVEGNFNREFYIKEFVNVSGIGNVYPYINKAFEYKLKRVDLFNPSIFIESDYTCRWIDFDTRCIGVDIN